MRSENAIASINDINSMLFFVYVFCEKQMEATCYYYIPVQF